MLTSVVFARSQLENRPHNRLLFCYILKSTYTRLFFLSVNSVRAPCDDGSLNCLCEAEAGGSDQGHWPVR